MSTEQANAQQQPYDLTAGLTRIFDLAMLSETPANMRVQAYQDRAVIEQWIIKQLKAEEARNAEAVSAPEQPKPDNIVPIKGDAECQPQ